MLEDIETFILSLLFLFQKHSHRHRTLYSTFQGRILIEKFGHKQKLVSLEVWLINDIVPVIDMFHPISQQVSYSYCHTVP